MCHSNSNAFSLWGKNLTKSETRSQILLTFKIDSEESDDGANTIVAYFWDPKVSIFKGGENVRLKWRGKEERVIKKRRYILIIPGQAEFARARRFWRAFRVTRDLGCNYG